MGYSAESLIKIYKSMKPGAVGVEVGVCRGENIRQILIACPNIEKIYGVDPWTEYDARPSWTPIFKAKIVPQATCDTLFKTANEVLAKYIAAGKAELIREFSIKAADKFKNVFFDFVFIDGNHSYEEVLKDLAAWWPKVKPGGIFSGHDFRKKDIEVRKAVYEFTEKLGLTVIETEVNSDCGPTCWHYFKPVAK